MWSHPCQYGAVIPGAQVCVCECVCVRVLTFTATSAVTTTAKLKNHPCRVTHTDGSQTAASVCVHVVVQESPWPLRWEFPCTLLELYIVLAHHTASEGWVHCKLSKNTSRSSKGASHFSCEWHILGLETPNTSRPSIYLSIHRSLSTACRSQLDLELMLPIWPHEKEREKERLRAGWGERRSCLPAHGVISSRCGYCKWDGEGE